MQSEAAAVSYSDVAHLKKKSTYYTQVRLRLLLENLLLVAFQKITFVSLNNLKSILQTYWTYNFPISCHNVRLYVCFHVRYS